MNSKILWRAAMLLALVPLGALAEDAAKPAAKPAAEATIPAEQQRAQRLLNHAVEYYKDKKDAALAAFSRQGEFIDGELYVYVLSTDGVMVASGGSSSALIGQKVADMRDAAGNPFFREMLDKAKAESSGTVEYRWLNRVDNKVERKITYFQKVGKNIIAVGYYIPRATPEQAKGLLDRAADAVKADPAKAFEAFNQLRGKYSEDDLYVFVVDMTDNRFKAHGVNHRLVGTDGMALRDPAGKPIIQEMVAALKTKDNAEVDYVWPNPVTNKVEKKHTLLRKVGNYLVGVGYYTR